MDFFDWRIAVVLLPLLVAAGWAGFNILSVALVQINKFLNKEA